MMRAAVLFVLALGAEAAVFRPQAGLIRVNTSTAGPYGNPGCPCVGIDNLDGSTTVSLGDNKTKDHKADLGAHCETWEEGWHPDCKGDKAPAWCKQKWCYVDPCNCNNVADFPKPSDYLPDAKYQGKPLHYSYATCGGTDSYTSGKKRDALKDLETKHTCATVVDPATWGEENCRCVGIGPQPGTTDVHIDGKEVAFPADTGAFCKKWEEGRHPECNGSSPPKWCSQAWCYVDPCSCKLKTPPKTSSYVPDANYQGRPVYYSYATCGGEDAFSAGDKNACVSQHSSEACGKLSKCAWNGKECLGKELVEVCHRPFSYSGAWSPKTLAALVMSLAAFMY